MRTPSLGISRRTRSMCLSVVVEGLKAGGRVWLEHDAGGCTSWQGGAGFHPLLLRYKANPKQFLGDFFPESNRSIIVAILHLQP